MTLGDFTQQAGTYHQARPTYPDALLDRLIAYVGVQPGDPVADIGAGTGIFTQLLAERGLLVTALEPNPAMRAHAERRPNVTWRDATFEHTTLPDASQAWITAAQAFHWADPPHALPELHRILRPNGRVTVLWNNRLNADEPVLDRAWRTIKRFVPDFDDHYRDNRDWPAVLTSTGRFADAHYDETRHVVAMPTQRFLNLWRSHNRLVSTAGPRRFAELIAAIERDLDRDGVTEAPVPYLCRAWTVTRVG